MPANAGQKSICRMSQRVSNSTRHVRLTVSSSFLGQRDELQWRGQKCGTWKVAKYSSDTREKQKWVENPWLADETEDDEDEE